MLNKKSILWVGLITSLGVFAGLATADPEPLPGTVLNSSGVQIYTSVNVPAGNPTYPVSFGFGSGGGFTTTIDSTNTVMWCVDAMEDISPPTTYNADLVEVSQIAANSSDVRYGNVSGTSGPNSWGISIPGDNTAQLRYEMAAYLTSQYPGVTSTDPAGPNPSNTLTDQELQAAIWETMWNNSISSESGITLASVETGDGSFTSAEQTAVAGYITAAQTFVNNPANASFFNSFAVVSGGVSSSGALLAASGIQTYIVPVDSPVPEPASFVLFGSLIAGLFLHTRRLRTRARRVR